MYMFVYSHMYLYMHVFVYSYLWICICVLIIIHRLILENLSVFHNVLQKLEFAGVKERTPTSKVLL